MPAIYTFSLDYGRDRDIIDLLESKKNRSDYIRTILRQDNMLNLYMEAFDLLYNRYRSAMKGLDIEPYPKAHFLTQNKHHKWNQKEEASTSKSLKLQEECFTCQEVGKEHCNIHMNYHSEE